VILTCHNIIYPRYSHLKFLASYFGLQVSRTYPHVYYSILLRTSAIQSLTQTGHGPQPLDYAPTAVFIILSSSAGFLAAILSAPHRNTYPSDSTRLHRDWVARTLVTITFSFHSNWHFYRGDLAGSEPFITYTDASHGDCVDTGHSTAGFVTMMAGGAIGWYSKLQTIVALCTTEAEYMAAIEAGNEIAWIRNILSEFEYGAQQASTLKMDNQSAISVSKNPEHHSRMKHLDLRFYWLAYRQGGKWYDLSRLHSYIGDDCRLPYQVHASSQGSLLQRTDGCLGLIISFSISCYLLSFISL